MTNHKQKHNPPKNSDRVAQVAAPIRIQQPQPSCDLCYQGGHWMSECSNGNALLLVRQLHHRIDEHAATITQLLARLTALEKQTTLANTSVE